MQLEDYLDLHHPAGIRIKGTRINIEDVVFCVQDGLTATQIVQEFPSLTLEQVHAVLAYYYRNQAPIDDYIARELAAFDEEKRQQDQGERPEVVKRLLRLKAEREGKVST
jgi:uncharacterized protein (DUF433 family)